MLENIIDYRDLNHDQENYTDLFHDNIIRISPYRYGLTEKVLMAVFPFIWLACAIGIVFVDKANAVEDWVIAGLCVFAFLGSGYAVFGYFSKKSYDVFVDYLGFRKTVDGARTSWADVTCAKFDYLGLKIVERSGEKHRIYLSEDDRDASYFMDLMLKNLVWLHGKTSVSSDGLITNLLRKMDFGLTFGKEMAQKYRQDHIHLYTGGVVISVVLLVCVLGLLWLGGSLQHVVTSLQAFLEHGFNAMDFVDVGYGELKGVGLVGCFVFIILAQLYLIFHYAFIDKTAKKAEIIKADKDGLRITYPDGREQSVTWQKMDNLWQDPNYGADGNLHFLIHHSTDGAKMLIDFLPYAVDDYVRGDKTYSPK